MRQLSRSHIPHKVDSIESTVHDFLVLRIGLDDGQITRNLADDGENSGDVLLGLGIL